MGGVMVAVLGYGLALFALAVGLHAAADYSRLRQRGKADERFVACVSMLISFFFAFGLAAITFVVLK